MKFLSAQKQQLNIKQNETNKLNNNETNKT